MNAQTKMKAQKASWIIKARLKSYAGGIEYWWIGGMISMASCCGSISASEERELTAELDRLQARLLSSGASC